MVAFRGLPTGYEIEDGFGVTKRILRVIERIVENLESFKDVNDFLESLTSDNFGKMNDSKELIKYIGDCPPRFNLSTPVLFCFTEFAPTRGH